MKSSNNFVYIKQQNLYLKVFVFIFLFTLLSGALRKWVITSKDISNGVFFLQTVLPYTFLIVNDGFKKWHVGRPALTFIILVLIVGMLNPLNLTIYHGLIGFLLHFNFFFIILFYLSNREKFNFLQIMHLLVFIAFSQLVLVFYQYTQPPDSFVNTYADVESVNSVALVGKAARVTGTFSYISGFTAYLFFHSLLVWTMIKCNYRNIYTLLLLSMGLIACFMSGSRSATYLYILVFTFIFILEYQHLNKVFLDFKLFVPLALIGLFIIGVSNDKFTGLIENAFSGFMERRSRGIHTGEESERLFADIYELFNFKGNFPLLGVGLGSTYQGANQLFGVSPYIQEYGFFESELIRIILEGGFLLFVVRIILISYLIRQLMIPTLAKLFFSFIIIFFFPVIFNIYNAVFAALGLMLLDNIYYQQFRLSSALGNQRHSIANSFKF